MPRPLFSEAALDSGGVASTVGYKLDLSGEPSEGVRAFLGIPIDSVGDGKSVSLRYRLGGLGEEMAVQVRVRQYEKAGAEAYYPLLDWQEVEGAGQQTLEIPIDSERVAAGGRTYVEWRFQRRGGGSFEKGAVELQDIAYERKQWDWYTQVVMSCEQEDNYRFGFNGQEKVNEISGVGNTLDFGARMYDSRLGRFPTTDPLQQKFPNHSPYIFANDNPIWLSDINGEYGYPKNNEKEYTKKYPILTNYLKYNVNSDVMESPTLRAAFLKYTGGNLDDTKLSKATSWKSGPNIVIKDRPGAFEGAYGYYNTGTGQIELSRSLADQLENATVGDRQAALTSLFITLTHETVHYGDLLDGSQTKGEAGNDFANEVYHIMNVNIGEGKTTPVINPVEDSGKIPDAKNIIKRKYNEGKGDVIPTVPQDKPIYSPK